MAILVVQNSHNMTTNDEPAELDQMRDGRCIYSVSDEMLILGTGYSPVVVLICVQLRDKERSMNIIIQGQFHSIYVNIEVSFVASS